MACNGIRGALVLAYTSRRDFENEKEIAGVIIQNSANKIDVPFRLTGDILDIGRLLRFLTDVRNDSRAEGCE